MGGISILTWDSYWIGQGIWLKKENGFTWGYCWPFPVVKRAGTADEVPFQRESVIRGKGRSVMWLCFCCSRCCCRQHALLYWDFCFSAPPASEAGYLACHLQFTAKAKGPHRVCVCTPFPPCSGANDILHREHGYSTPAYFGGRALNLELTL